MLSDEEKQAIEELKNFKSDKDCKFWIGLNGEKAIDIIINLIEKQQDEIEELKDTRSIFNMGRRSYKNEIENKIKAKIEEIDEVLKGQLIEKIRVYFEAQKEVLQSLLEKGNENE